MFHGSLEDVFLWSFFYSSPTRNYPPAGMQLRSATSALSHGPVVSPTFLSLLPHACQLPCVRRMTCVATGTRSPCSYTSRLSPAAIQPHDSRFFSRSSMQGRNCSRLGPIRMRRLNAYYIYTAAPVASMHLLCHCRSELSKVHFPSSCANAFATEKTSALKLDFIQELSP
jgi:hypothetical protein